MVKFSLLLNQRMMDSLIQACSSNIPCWHSDAKCPPQAWRNALDFQIISNSEPWDHNFLADHTCARTRVRACARTRVRTYARTLTVPIFDNPQPVLNECWKRALELPLQVVRNRRPHHAPMKTLCRPMPFGSASTACCLCAVQGVPGARRWQGRHHRPKSP